MQATTRFTIDEIGRVCHEANRAYCIVNNDQALPEWDLLEESYRESTRIGVHAVLEGSTPKESHQNWMKERLYQGWKFGPVLDRERKVHPNLIPYDELPVNQKIKDHLFVNIVKALTGM